MKIVMDIIHYKDVTIILLNENGTEVLRTTTDENGNCEFTNLVPGKYIVRDFDGQGDQEKGWGTLG